MSIYKQWTVSQYWFFRKKYLSIFCFDTIWIDQNVRLIYYCFNATWKDQRIVINNIESLLKKKYIVYIYKP